MSSPPCTGRPFPTLSSFYMEQALPLISYLRSLPDPHGATASSLISAMYASVRGAYVEESLRSCAKDALDDAKPERAAPAIAVSLGQSPRPDGGNGGGDAARLAGRVERRTFGRFLDAFLAMIKVSPGIAAPISSRNEPSKHLTDARRGALPRNATFRPTQSEHAILTTLFLTQSATASTSSLPAANLPAIYASLLPPALTLLSSTGTSLNALIKRSSTSTSTTSATTQHSAALAPLALITFQEIQEHMDGFEEWARVKANKRKENELGELSHAFRGTCLTSLPAVIEDTKVSNAGGSWFGAPGDHRRNEGQNVDGMY